MSGWVLLGLLALLGAGCGNAISIREENGTCIRQNRHWAIWEFSQTERIIDDEWCEP